MKKIYSILALLGIAASAQAMENKENIENNSSALHVNEDRKSGMPREVEDIFNNWLDKRGVTQGQDELAKKLVSQSYLVECLLRTLKEKEKFLEERLKTTYAQKVSKSIVQKYAQQLGYNDDFATIKTRADHGDAASMYLLGVLHEAGIGTPKNMVEAVASYERAGQKGHMVSWCHLGFLHIMGVVIPRNEVKALSYFDKAKDDSSICLSVAVAYRKGIGFQQDELKGRMWYSRCINLTVNAK